MKEELEGNQTLAPDAQPKQNYRSINLVKRGLAHLVPQEPQPTLFDLMGKDWGDSAVQSFVARLGEKRAVELDATGIYDFKQAGVKIFTDKTRGAKEISEIYIRGNYEHFQQQVGNLPFGLRFRQPQRQVREALGEPYDSQIAYAFPYPSDLEADICVTPAESDGWDIFLSSELPPMNEKRFANFILIIHYPLSGTPCEHIYDEQGNVILSVPTEQYAGEFHLKQWNGQPPQRRGYASIQALIED